MVGIDINGRGAIVDGGAVIAGPGLQEIELQEANWVDENGYVSTNTDYDESGDGDCIHFYSDGTDIYGRQGYHATFTADQWSSMEFWYNETDQKANGYTLVVADGNGRDIVGVGTDSPEWVRVTGWNSGRYPDSGTGDFTSTRVRLNFDWANKKVEGGHEEKDGSPSASFGPDEFINPNADQIGLIALYSTSFFKGSSGSPNNRLDYWQLFPNQTFSDL